MTGMIVSAVVLGIGIVLFAVGLEISMNTMNKTTREAWASVMFIGILFAVIGAGFLFGTAASYDLDQQIAAQKVANQGTFHLEYHASFKGFN